MTKPGKRPIRERTGRTTGDPIEHVIVLMLENRSFDHILGAISGVDGVDPNAPFENTDPQSGTTYPQKNDAADKLSPDPAHENEDVLRQIYGSLPVANRSRDMSGFVADFVARYPRATNSVQQVMSYYAPGRLPALHTLAQEFCVCDKWFSSVPGPTWTNRFFVHSATSQGWVEMPHLFPPDFNLHKYDQTTIYDRLNERGISWRIYVGDIGQSMVLQHQRRLENVRRYARMANFGTDVADTDGSDFPAYVFIEPSYLKHGQNDQHPPSDVQKGDDLIATVFNAIRSNETLWESTLLIITYDEHGGFCDHVPPPDAVSPDGKSQEGFDFTIYGVRVPTVLVSPWVARGRVFRSDSGVLDHTSILRYLMDKYDLGPLTARSQEAASFRLAIERTKRAETPKRVGAVPRGVERAIVLEGPVDRLNPNQAALIEFTKQLEIQAGTSPDLVGLRSIRARSSADANVETAVERFWEYVDRGARP